MRWLITVFFTAVFSVSTAAAAELSPVELGRAVNFAQRMQGIYDAGMQLSFDMDNAETYIGSYFDGEVETEEFTAVINPFLEDMDESVADFRVRYSSPARPPVLGSKKHEKSLGAFAQSIVSLAGMLERQLRILYRMRDAALAGDDMAYNTATADSLGLTADMIDAENISIAASLVAVGPDHPQHGLSGAIMGGNEAMAVALRVLEASTLGEGFDAGSYALQVETSLRDAERAIVAGEKANREMLASLDGKFAKTEADRHGARFIGDITRAYERAFAIEREILISERGLLDYLRAVNAGEETADSAFDAIGAYQGDLEEQVELRVSEYQTRIALAAELARSLERLEKQ